MPRQMIAKEESTKCHIFLRTGSSVFITALQGNTKRGKGVQGTVQNKRIFLKGVILEENGILR